MISTILLSAAGSPDANPHAGYFFGIIVFLFILGYLIYTLVKPNKF